MKKYSNFIVPRKLAFLGVGLLPSIIFIIGFVISVFVGFFTSFFGFLISVIFFTLASLFLLRIHNGLSLFHIILNYISGLKKRTIKANSSYTGKSNLPELIQNINLSNYKEYATINHYYSLKKQKKPLYNTIVLQGLTDGIDGLYTEEQQADYINQYAQWLQTLSDNPSIVSAQFVIEKYERSKNILETKVLNNAQEVINEALNKISENTYKINMYISITYRHNMRKTFRRNLDDIYKDSKKHQDKLKAANISTRILNLESLVKYFSKVYTDEEIENTENIRNLDQLAPNLIVETPNAYQLNNKIHYNYRLNDIPVGNLSPKYIHDLLTIHRESAKRLCMVYKPVDKRMSSKSVEQLRKIKVSEAYMSGNKTKMRDIKQIEDSDNLAMQDAYGDNIIDCTIYLTDIIDENEEYYPYVSNDFKLAYRTQNIAFHQTLPIGLMPWKLQKIPVWLEELI